MAAIEQDWSKPAAMAIPKEGYFEFERGRFGPIYPRTPACYGFSIIAKVKDGREEAIRAYGKQIEEAIAASPEVLAPLRLALPALGAVRCRLGPALSVSRHFRHRLRQVHRRRGGPVQPDWHHDRLHQPRGVPGGLEGNTAAFAKFVREHQFPSFLEYGEYPYVTADEVKKALRLKAAFSDMLDQMQ
jgi:hypothetical protein